MTMLKAEEREKRHLKKRHAPKGGTAGGQRARIAVAKGYVRVRKKVIPRIKMV